MAPARHRYLCFQIVCSSISIPSMQVLCTKLRCIKYILLQSGLKINLILVHRWDADETSRRSRQAYQHPVCTETHDKLFYIAEYEGRSGSGQIMYLIRKCIAEFEKEHGKIEWDENKNG